VTEVKTSREFQFHSGSIQTASFLVDRVKLENVSIPLWFDSNVIKLAEKGVSPLVSIPLWFDSNWHHE